MSVGKNQTHYQILGVPEGSTTSEIKSAFLTLSKTHHPDFHPNDPTKHHKFVRIMEAYSVLSKPGLRSTYDHHLYAASRTNTNPSPYSDYGNFDVQTNAPRYTTWRDESIYEMRNRDNDRFYEERPYYGIKGIKKMSNLWIAGGAAIFMVAGAVFHFFALKKSSVFTVSQLDRKDLRLGNELRVAKQKASENGNSLQIELLEAKFAVQERD